MLESAKDADVLEEEELIKTGKVSNHTAVVLNRLVKTYQKKDCGCCPTKGGVFRAVKFPDKDTCYTLGYTNSRDKNVQLLMEQIQLDNEIPDEEVIAFISESQANLFLLNNPNMTTAGTSHNFLLFG